MPLHKLVSELEKQNFCLTLRFRYSLNNMKSSNIIRNVCMAGLVSILYSCYFSNGKGILKVRHKRTT